jgi:PAS domain-containing protein
MILRRALMEEKRAHAIQRASAEQNRRVMECLQAFHETLLQHLDCPNFSLDAAGCVVRWSPAMARWSGQEGLGALKKPLSEALCPELALPILEACQQTLMDSETSAEADSGLVRQGVLPGASGSHPALFTLIPLYRIPGCLEEILVLLEPL